MSPPFVHCEKPAMPLATRKQNIIRIVYICSLSLSLSLSVASRRQEIDFHDITICLAAIEGGMTFHIFHYKTEA